MYHSDGRLKGLKISAFAHARKLRASRADVISFSGCKDSQTSADTVEGGLAVGAMSYAFMLSLKQEPNQTFQGLLKSVRRILRDKYDQKPQLSSSHKIVSLVPNGSFEARTDDTSSGHFFEVCALIGIIGTDISVV
jgi:metacaspase-1